MSVTATGAASRRVRYGVRAAAIAAASLACIVMAVLAISRASVRLDVTALGDQRLSPRTRQALDRLEGDYEIVLAGQWSAPDGAPGVPDRRIRRQVFDVLSDIERLARHLTVTRLDTLTDAGQEAYQDLLDRLAERERAVLDRHEATVRSGAAALRSHAENLLGLSPLFERVRDSISPGTPESDRRREAYLTRASVVRILAGRMRDQASEVDRLVSERVGAAPVGRIDQAGAALIDACEVFDRQLGQLATDLGSALQSDSLSPEFTEPLRAAQASIESWRPALRKAGDEAKRLPRPDVLRVARLLESSPAAIVIGPPDIGLTAISFDALFPTPHEDQARSGLEADARRRAEEVLTIALTTLTNPDAPIVIFVHGEGGPYLLESGAIDALRRRLELNRVSVLEWAPVVEASPPSTLAIDSTRKRPVVYIVMGTDSSAGVGNNPSLSGPARASALARAVNQIIEAGDPLLLSLAPSTAPSWGGVDEIAKALEAFGISADTGRPILHETQAPEGRLVESVFRATALAGENPVNKALAGLPTQFRWPLALTALPDSPVQRTPLFEIAGAGAWAEAEWLGLWRYFAQNRVDAVGGTGIPTPNEGIDLVRGPWTIGYLADRPLAGGKTQRLAAIGANGWFFDAQTLPTINPNGTTTPANPGNAELFNACLYWLAGQDQLIAPGPASRAVARIRPLEAGQRRALSWGLIAGLPLIVLAVGVIVRVWRG